MEAPITNGFEPSSVEPAVAGALQPDQEGRRARVLVVDDESLTRWSVGQTLLDYGMDPILAADGKSAIKAIAVAPEPFDVVLLDYELPDSSNWSVLNLVKQMSPISRVVVMTAFPTPEMAVEARTRGACVIQPKPFELDDVADLIGALAESVAA
jgi:DNA-binding NtrC family response regulator